MILRKPYAFLIKQFKLIHLVLMFLSVYILFQTSDISTFFNTYVENGFTAIITKNFASNFINATLIFVLFALLVCIISIKILLMYKKKKDKLYFFTIGYYLFLVVYFIFFNIIFNTMENELLDADLALIYKDIALLVYLPQYFFVLFFAIRALGFNVKQFDFSKDLKDLNLSNDDNEEVEINVTFESYKAKRRFNRFIREMKYYYLENKFIFIAICFILFFTISYNIVKNFSYFKDNHYSIKQSFYYKNLKITVLDADITNTDQGGKIIKEGSYFLTLSVEVNNDTLRDLTMDLNSFDIMYNGVLTSPNNVYQSYFSDYGAKMISTNIKHSTSKVYALVYEIKEEDINDDFNLKLFYSTYVEGGVTYPRYIIVDLNSEILNTVKISSSELNDTVSFDKSLVGDSTFSANSYSLNNLFYYDAEKCIKDNCVTYQKSLYVDHANSTRNNTILKLESELKLDTETIYYRNNRDDYSFFTNFVSVKYIKNGKYITEKTEALTADTNDGSYYLLVPSDAAKSNELSLIINVRNREYIYKLK